VIRLRPATNDADLEVWRQVRIEVVPDERAATVEEMRAAATPETAWLLVELDGEVAGSGLARRSDFAGSGFVAPRVLPEFRRRGVGTALLIRSAKHLQAHGFAAAHALVDDAGSLAFAEQFGFREVDRQVEQVLTIDEAVPETALPEGIEIVSLAERPELFERTYTDLALEAFEDMPTEATIAVSSEDWKREWLPWPKASFVALAGGELVGCAGLIRDHDTPDRAEHSLTAVRREWRRRGVGRALKQRTIAWAAANGISEVYTWTQRGNDDMRRLNEQLGYVTRSESISLRAGLPLP
jgi:mycothiol synthase